MAKLIGVFLQIRCRENLTLYCTGMNKRESLKSVEAKVLIVNCYMNRLEEEAVLVNFGRFPRFA
jgi:hypothetical protein